MPHKGKWLLFLFLLYYLLCRNTHRPSLKPGSHSCSWDLLCPLAACWSPLLVWYPSGLLNSSWELPRVECPHVVINNYPCIFWFYAEIEKHVYVSKNLCMFFAHIPPPPEGSVGACEECRIGSGDAYIRGGRSLRNHTPFFGIKITSIFGLFPICAGKSFGERQIYSSRFEAVN